jgi:hypothetical protein
MRQIYILFLFSALLFGQESRETVSNYWIIENPIELVIFNQYEQRLTEPEKSRLPQYSAWQILDEDHVFSDQYTHTVKTRLNRQVFYIQLSDDSEPVNADMAGNIEKIRNARIQGDTVRIKSSNQLSLQSGANKNSLIEGMLIERIFRYQNKYFCKDIAGNISGWMSGNGQSGWEIYIPDNLNLVLENQIFIRIDKIISSYNTRLDKLFSFLNDHYGVLKSSPRWIVEKSPEFLKYNLIPQTYQNRFPDSQTYLIQELEDLLYGSIYSLSATDGQIIIHKSSN